MSFLLEKPSWIFNFALLSLYSNNVYVKSFLTCAPYHVDLRKWIIYLYKGDVKISSKLLKNYLLEDKKYVNLTKWIIYLALISKILFQNYDNLYSYNLLCITIVKYFVLWWKIVCILAHGVINSVEEINGRCMGCWVKAT